MILCMVYNGSISNEWGYKSNKLTNHSWMWEE